MGVRTTKISRLDESLRGGIRHSTINLLWAQPGTESAPFAYHIIKESLAEGDHCIYVTSCKDTRTVEKEMKALGWDVSKYRKSGNLLFVDAYSSLVNRLSFERFHVENPRKAKEITKELIRALKTIPQGTHILVVYDSISSLIDHCGEDAVNELALWKRLFAKNNATGVFLFTEWPYDSYVLDKVHNLSDAIIKFLAVMNKSGFQEYFEVSKLGWVPSLEASQQIPYRIEPSGINILDGLEE